MKFLYFLIVVMLGASGFFAYKEGYLASVHPLLDPAARDGEEGGEIDTETTGTGPVGRADLSADTTGSDSTKSPPKTKAQVAADKQLAKEEKAERDRLAKEARLAEREAQEAARAAEDEERLKRRTMLDGEIDALRAQYAAVYDQQKAGKEKMRQQENAWAQEKIKTREVERQQLRDASDNYLNQLEAQMTEIDRLIIEKKKLY